MLDVAQSVRASLKWMGSAKLLAQLVSWVSTLLIMRMLSPGDYGLMAIAGIFVGLATLFQEMGLQSAIIQRDVTSVRQLESMYGWILLINIFIYFLLFLFAPVISWFFHEPLVTDLVRVLGLQFPIAAFAAIQIALAKRSLRFKAIATIQTIEVVVSSGLSLVLAYSGFGVWALAFGGLGMVAVRAVGFLYAVKDRFRPRISMKGMGQIAEFGGYVMVSRMLWYLYSRMDRFIVGKVLGTSDLGIYSVAMQLATLPMQKVGGILADVGFSAFSRANREEGAIDDYFLKSIRLLSAVAFPVFFGIALVAHPLVMVVLGEKWVGTSTIIILLSIVVPLRLAASVTAPGLMAVGMPQVVLGNNIVVACLMLGGFLVASLSKELVIIAAVWPVMFPVAFYIVIGRTSKAIGIDKGRVFRELWVPLGAGLGMYAVGRGLLYVMAARHYTMVMQLSILVVVGTVCYLSMVWAADRRLIKDVLAQWR